MNISSEVLSINGSNSSSYSNANTDPGFMRLVLYSLVCVASVLFGVPTNSYVIWLIVRGAGNGLAAEFFSVNLSICEILYSINSFFQLLQFAFTALTEAMNFFQAIATTGRPLFQCLICVERYLAVVHPVIFLKLKPLRYRVMCCVIVWVVILTFYGVAIKVSSVRIKYISIGFILVQAILFLFIQMFCLVSVLRALKQSGPGERRREKEDENHMKRRAFIIIQIITVTMIIINVPFIISLLLSLNESSATSTFMCISYACFGLAGLMLPFLFLHRVGKLPFVQWQMQ